MKALSQERGESYVAAFTKVVNEQPRVAFSQHELFRTNTGWKQSSEQFRESAEKRATLLEQTERMANALENQGIKARQDETGLIAIGEVTNKIDRVDGFRSICFFTHRRAA